MGHRTDMCLLMKVRVGVSHLLALRDMGYRSNSIAIVRDMGPLRFGIERLQKHAISLLLFGVGPEGPKMNPLASP